MTAIFLSYRRNDSAGFAGRLANDLEETLGENTVFRDVDDIVAGEQFDTAIKDRLQLVEVVLVVIGPNWWVRKPDGSRRIDDPDDFVRLEIVIAIAAGKPIIPVLVGGASMPAPGDLPEDLSPLSRFQAIEITDARWDYDLTRLVAALEPVIQGQGRRDWIRRLHRIPATTVLALVILAVFSGAVFLWHINRIPKIYGIWDLPSGSFWTIDQEGSMIKIEETHYDSRQVWKRGKGTISGKTIEVIADPVFDNPYRYKYLYRLRLIEDGRRLSGTMTELVRKRETPFDLRRR